MAWIEITRLKYQQDGLGYASDTTEDEWTLIEPLLPPACDRGRRRAGAALPRDRRVVAATRE